jgi:hypothetical protein
MSADHPTLVSYRKAIKAMQQLSKDDPTNPLGWRFQANMHGVKMDAGMMNEAWHWCMHGNWWFLPWHRGYLYFFEKIVRKLSGCDSFRLPYWPWEKDGQNALPAPFRDPKYQGKDNPLFNKNRVAAANNGDPLRPNPQGGSSGSFAIDWDRFYLALRRTGLWRHPKAEDDAGDTPRHDEGTRGNGIEGA